MVWADHCSISNSLWYGWVFVVLVGHHGIGKSLVSHCGIGRSLWYGWVTL